MNQLIYVMDPMCSWCWAFRSVLRAVQAELPPAVETRYVMGGLAPDSEQPMPLQMQHYLQQTWQAIEQRTGASFNFEFWEKCTPRRATYPACRAVIAAGLQGKAHRPAMVAAIQAAYYQQARNPSEAETLVALADETGLDAAQFAADLHGEEVAAQFRAERQLCQQLDATGFPSLLWQQGEQYRWLTRGYSEAEPLLMRLQSLLR